LKNGQTRLCKKAQHGIMKPSIPFILEYKADLAIFFFSISQAGFKKSPLHILQARRFL
jgi:hypothetical protein